MRKWLINTAVLVALVIAAMLLAKIAEPFLDVSPSPDTGMTDCPGSGLDAARNAFAQDYAAFVEAGHPTGDDPCGDILAFGQELVRAHGALAMAAPIPAVRAYFTARLALDEALATAPAQCAAYAERGLAGLGQDDRRQIGEAALGRAMAADIRLMAQGATTPSRYPPLDYGDVRRALDRWSAETDLPASAQRPFLEGLWDAADYCAGYRDFYADLAARDDPLSDQVRRTVLEARFTLTDRPRRP